MIYNIQHIDTTTNGMPKLAPTYGLAEISVAEATFQFLSLHGVYLPQNTIHKGVVNSFVFGDL